MPGTMMRYQNPELTDLLAAEYVMGTLKGAARRRFQGLLTTELKLQIQVDAWERRLGVLVQEVAPITPPAALWNELEQRLFADTAATNTSTNVGWTERLAFWRGLALGSGALAAVFAFLLIINPSVESPGYIVLINNDDQQAVWTVSAAADMETFRIRNNKPMAMTKGQGCLLWVQPEGSQQLYAVGLLPDDGSEMTLTIEERLRPLLNNAKFLVSVEDASATPPALPSSTPEFSGRLVPLTSI